MFGNKKLRQKNEKLPGFPEQEYFQKKWGGDSFAFC